MFTFSYYTSLFVRNQVGEKSLCFFSFFNNENHKMTWGGLASTT